MPPSIKPSYFQLVFRIFRAEKLPAMDMNLNILSKEGGKIDAYMQTVFLNKKLKTDIKIQKEGGFVDWNQEFFVLINIYFHLFFVKMIDTLLNSCDVKQNCDESI